MAISLYSLVMRVPIGILFVYFFRNAFISSSLFLYRFVHNRYDKLWGNHTVKPYGNILLSVFT